MLSARPRAASDQAIRRRHLFYHRTARSACRVRPFALCDFQLGGPTADLGVTVSDGLATVVAGDGLSHSHAITVSNGGPSDATTVSLTAAWPSGFVQGAMSPSQGSCASIGSSPDFSCDLGTIAAGGSATVTAGYTVPASASAGTRPMTVSVTSAVSDPDSTNDSATDTTDVVEVVETPAPGGGLPPTSTSPGGVVPSPNLLVIPLVILTLAFSGLFLARPKRP
jgi:Domain of unknown function DUF11